MLNHITIQARLVRDPELRRLPSGKSVASVSVACDRDFTKEGGEKETDFIDIVAFGKTADHLASYYTKGKMIIVSGRLQIRSYTDKDGIKRRAAEVVADHCYFGDSKNANADNPKPASTYAPSVPAGDFSEAAAMLNSLGYNGNVPTSDYALLDGDDSQLPF